MAHGDQAVPAWEIYSPRRRAVFVGVLFLVSMSASIDRQVVSVLLEPIKREFGASDAQLGLLTGLSFALFYATLGIPIARLADRYDRKRIIAASILAWSVMTMLCGRAASFAQLAATRVGVGVGEAGGGAPGQSLLADYYPPRGRARVFGISTLSATAGFLIGLGGGGWIAQHHGWRAAFLAAGAPGVAIAALVLLLLREPRRSQRFARSPDREGAGRTIAALWKKRSFVMLVTSSAMYGVMAYGALVFIPSFLVRVHGLTVAEAGARFGLISGLGALSGTLGGGWLADRLAPRGVRWLAWLPAAGMLAAWPIHAGAFLTGSLPLVFTLLFGGAMVLSAVVPSQLAAMHLVCGSARRATAVAVAGLVTNLLSAGLGPVIAGAVSDAFAASYGAGAGLRYAMTAMLTALLPAALLSAAAARRLGAETEP